LTQPWVKKLPPDQARQLSHKASAVQRVLAAHGLAVQVQELTESSRTAVDAARVVNCELGQIVKSLVFKILDTQEPVLVATSGSNRVSEAKIAKLLGAEIGRANADFVRQHTGYAIGGVAPIGHPQPMRTFIDEDLRNYSSLWAAAGTPNAMFEVSPDDLQAMTHGTVADIRE